MFFSFTLATAVLDLRSVSLFHKKYIGKWFILKYTHRSMCLTYSKENNHTPAVKNTSLEKYTSNKVAK